MRRRGDAARTKLLLDLDSDDIGALLAGLGMVDGVSPLLPTARVGHIGLARDESSLEPMRYYAKLPGEEKDRDYFILDPMLATGGSASQAITLLKSHGASPVVMVCVISAPEGVARLQADHPDVDIITAAHDRELNEHKYILPGLGDFGDRLFGTM